MKAPAGSEVSIYVDLADQVERGDIIQTQTGRRYMVNVVRVQARGAHQGRQHIRATVMPDDFHGSATVTIHTIRWYKRGSKGKRLRRPR